MLDLLKKIYYQIESLKGRSLLIFVFSSFLIFLSIGLLIGYFTDTRLKEDEPGELVAVEKPTSRGEIGKVKIEGKIQYTNPELYPGEDISYILADSGGNEIALLKAKDEILSVVENFEGLTVIVEGTKERSKISNRDVIVVQKVTFRNVPN